MAHKIEIVDNTLIVSVKDSHSKIAVSEIKALPENFINDWLEALRSGHYEQTTGKLCHVKKNLSTNSVFIGYCCLGVVASMRGYSNDILVGHGYLNNESIENKLVRLPKKLRKNSTINHFFGALNDDLKLTFFEIANIIYKAYNA